MIEQHEHVEVELAQGAVLPDAHHRSPLVADHRLQLPDDLVDRWMGPAAAPGPGDGIDRRTHGEHHTPVDDLVNRDHHVESDYQCDMNQSARTRRLGSSWAPPDRA